MGLFCDHSNCVRRRAEESGWFQMQLASIPYVSFASHPAFSVSPREKVKLSLFII